MVLQNINKNQFLLLPSQLFYYYFLLACAFLCPQKSCFFSSWLKPEPVNWVFWWPTFGRVVINIATCCEGFAMDVPPWGGPSFRWLLLRGCCRSFHMDALRFCSSEPVLQHKLCVARGCLLNAATRPHTTNIPWTNGNSKETLCDGCSIRYPNGIVGSKLISHGELWDEQSVTLDKGLSD